MKLEYIEIFKELSDNITKFGENLALLADLIQKEKPCMPLIQRHIEKVRDGIEWEVTLTL